MAAKETQIPEKISPGISAAIRLLYVHNSADFYGASRSLARLLSVLSPRFRPLVLLPADGALRQYLEALNVRVQKGHLAILSRYSSRLAALFWHFPVSVLRLWGLMRKERPQLVHTNSAVVFSPAFAAMLAGIPHVWHVRESFEEFSGPLWKLYSAYMQTFADRIICVSHATAAQFPKSSKILVIHNGFSLKEFVYRDRMERDVFRQKFHIAPNRLVVGCVGRIKWGRKGQEYLIQAAQSVKARGLKVICLIVGAPYQGNEPHLQRLRELVTELRLEDDIVFAGELADPKPAYAAMDIFVLPSAAPEPFGGVVMEAMATGLPVIATNLGGSPDQVVEGETGYLVPAADPGALAEKIEMLARDEALREKMGRAGRQRIGDVFSLETMAKTIEDLYDEVIGARGSFTQRK